MTADGSGKRSGSGFISRNNDDPTAEATFRFMDEAGLPRKATISWNVVPWWNGERGASSKELAEGLQQLEELCNLLPEIKAVVLVGRKAQRARRYFEQSTRDVEIICSFHPSPQNKNLLREGWNAIPTEWAKAKRALE